MDPFLQPKKSVVISYKQQFETVYNISSMQVATQEYYKDLGIIFSQDMSGDHYYKHMLSKAYKTLGLLHRIFSKQHLPEVTRNIINEIPAHVLLHYMETIPHQRHKDDRATPKKSDKVYSKRLRIKLL